MRKTISKLLIAAMLIGGSLFGTAQAADKDAPTNEEIIQSLQKEGAAVFPIGEPNTAYEKYFTGKSFLSNVSQDKNLPVYNVTFFDGAHTFWHIHHGTCQILIAESGRGYYQIWGEEPHELLPGQTATIPAGIKHWHGAAPNTSFQHIALMQQIEGVWTEWLEPVNEDDYKNLRR